jgi:hypothetical protein
MVIVRKLGRILRELKPLEEQAKVEGFLNNVKNADKLGGLVEGIRDVVMDYQVCNWSRPATVTIMPDICFRHLCSKVSIARTVSSL